MAGTVIDSFMIALGFQVDPAGLKNVKKQADEAKNSLLGVGTALKAFVAGFAIKEIADIGSTFENNKNSIAGFLSEMGLSSDFNAGLRDAEDIVNKITIDAAKWPGEAEDYIKVFKAGLPFLKDAVPGGRNGIVDFLDNLTAVVKSKNPDIDIGTIARETREIFEGRAMLRNNVFMSLLPSLKLLDGQAGLTAQKFNAMTQPQRVQLLQALFARMKPQIDAAAGSFDAMWGAAVSATKQITRLATVPLFKAMKKGLDALNATFYDSNGKLTDFGKNFVDTSKTIIGWIGQILGMGGAFVSWLVHSKVGMMGLKLAAIAVGLALAGMAVESTISMFAKLVKGIGNVKRALIGGLFIALVLIAEDIYTFIKGGDSLTGMLVNKLGPALTILTGVVTTLGLAFVALRPVTFLNVVGLLIGKIGTLVGTLVGGGFAAVGAWMPMILLFVGIAAAIYGAVKAIDALDAKFEGFRHTRMQIRGALGLANDDEKAALAGEASNKAARDPGLVWQRYEPAAAGGPGSYSPATSGPGAAAGGAAAGGTTIHQTTIEKVEIHSNSDQPQQVARETAREITRNAQKGYR